MPRIAIIEDDKEISGILNELLTRNGYQTECAFDGGRASIMLREESFDLVLMDLMLPYKDGGSLIAELRSRSDTPVIVISAKSMTETKLEMLRLGADDYIIKPFDLDEVLVRIEVVLRRTGAAQKRDSITIGDITYFTKENRTECQGEPLKLTAKELMLLKLFMESPQRVYSKAELYETVWEQQYYYEDNTINVHMSNLRSKLKKASGHDCIETVWGIGYRMKGGG
ncbi:MAG: response regulator transcription factor [Ruminococcus sp.]|nr:response regulator transcription factor [Ruminococcus sp.]